MTRRVIIDSTAASPLRVSVAGVDAATAEFNDLIFDGNQSPLRLWGTGYVLVDGVTFNEWTAGQNAREATGPTVLATPAGTTPVFMVMVRLNDTGTSVLSTPTFTSAGFQDQGGGGICSGSFIGISFARGAPGSPTALPFQLFCNYAVFKNYN